MTIAITLTLVVSGTATFYAPGVMDGVVAYRQSSGQIMECPDCLGYVALVDAEWIGKRVYLSLPWGIQEGPFLVADCARQQEREGLGRRGWAVDVDWGTWQRWGVPRRPLPGVEVLLQVSQAVQGQTSYHNQSDQRR